MCYLIRGQDIAMITMSQYMNQISDGDVGCDEQETTNPINCHLVYGVIIYCLLSIKILTL